MFFTVHDDRETVQHAIVEEGADFFLSKAAYDAEKWTTVFYNLLGKKNYSLGEVILFNQSKDWQDSPNVLVVEDEGEWFQRIAELSTDIHFFWAETVQQAKGKLRELSYDLVIVDLYFIVDGARKLQGDQFIHFVNDHYASLPVIAISIDSSPMIRMLLSQLRTEKDLFKDNFEPERWLQIIQWTIEAKRAKDRYKAR